MLVTQDSIGHLKTLYMSVLSLAVVFEWKRYSSWQSDKKMLAFEIEFSLTYITFPTFVGVKIIGTTVIPVIPKCIDCSDVIMAIHRGILK